MKNTSEEVFKKLKEENIKPRPYWHFVMKNYFIWMLFVISIILGSLAFSMILFMIRQLDWDIYRYLGESFLKTFFISLPYLWVLFLLLFIGVAYYNFLHTKRGYRFRFISIFLISLTLSALFGTGLYYNGFSENIENVFFEKIPYYSKMVYTCEKQWMQPRKGLLAGIIKEIELSKNSIKLMDLNDQLWQIDTSKTIWRGKLQPLNGLQIKLIGKMMDNTHFQAFEIRPWKGHGKFINKE